jgi:RNA polymerase sigma factor (sigma-70 family)
MSSRPSNPDAARPATTEELLSHADWVRRLSRALLSDANEAEDVAQDAWVAALRRPPTAGDGLRGWWARVVRSTASNHRRSESRRTEREQRIAFERAEATDPQIDTTLEAHRRLAAAIEALDEPLRSVIVAHYFHGASSREIAEREGVADSTIRTRLQKALGELRRELDERAGGERKAWAGLLAPLAKLEHGAVPAAAGAVVIAGWIKLAAGLALVGIAGVTLYEALQPRGAPIEIAAAQPVVPPTAPQPLSTPATDSPRKENPPALAAAAQPAPQEEPLARVDARLLDAHGAPIRGARMKLTDRSASGECTDEQAPQSLSDGAGSVSLSIRDADRSRRRGKRGGLPANTWDGELEFSCRGYATRTEYVTLVLGESSALGDFVLQEGADLSGRCIASDGIPLAKIWVRLTYPDLSLDDRAGAKAGTFSRPSRMGSALCAADGSFSMPGVPIGSFRVYATAEKHSASISEPFRLATGEQHVVPDLVLEDCSIAIRGKVLEADGSPAAEAEIEYTFGAEGRFVRTRAEKDGTFTLVGVPPLVDIYARHADGDSGEAVLRGARAGESGLVLTLPPPHRFNVHVEDPSGAPVERYSLGIHCTDGTGFGGRVQAPGGTCARIARARPFLVRVDADGFAALEQGPFTQDSVPASIEFRLPVSASVAGRLVGIGGPGNRLEVNLDALFDKPRVRADGMPQLAEHGTRTSARDDGSFAIGVRGSGRFLLWGDGRIGNVVFTFTKPVELSVGRPLEGLVIDVATAGSIAGHVETTLDTQGRASQVLYSCGLGDPRCERIAPDGSFRIEGLAPGTWWLRVMPDTSNSEALLPEGTRVEDSLLKRVEVAPGESTRCDFDVRGPEPCRIEGRVLLQGASSESWTAAVTPEDRWWDAHRTATPLSADGSFGLHAATFGPQILSLRSPGTPARDDVIEAHVLVPADGLHWNLACDLGTLEVEGKPAAQIQVVADLGNGTTWTTHAILDANGRATLDALPAAKLRVSVAGSKDSPVEVEIPARGLAQARLP